jgi:hypothetical protein
LDGRGNPIKCRSLLESGSQTRLAQLLEAKKDFIYMPVFGINEKCTVIIKHKINATVRSRVTDFTVNLDFLVLSRITGNIPTTAVDTTTWKIPANIQLTDPDFGTPQTIDMLLGAEVFFDVWFNHSKTVHSGGSQHACYRHTPTKPTAACSSFCGLVNHSNTDLLDQMRKFWELESCDDKKKPQHGRKSDGAKFHLHT